MSYIPGDLVVGGNVYSQNPQYGPSSFLSARFTVPALTVSNTFVFDYSVFNVNTLPTNATCNASQALLVSLGVLACQITTNTTLTVTSQNPSVGGETIDILVFPSSPFN